MSDLLPWAPSSAVATSDSTTPAGPDRTGSTTPPGGGTLLSAELLARLADASSEHVHAGRPWEEARSAEVALLRVLAPVRRGETSATSLVASLARSWRLHQFLEAS